jgi:outer membrane immunogenic protein
MTMKATPAFLLAVLALAAAARAQSAPAVVPYNPSTPSAELALGYSYLHANAPPGGCGCFSMNGFVVQVGFPVERKGFSMVGDLTFDTNHNVLGTDTKLTLGAFAAGARYRFIHNGWEPFGEVEAGGIQATGAYKNIGITSPASASLSFVGIVGGGLDRRLSTHFGLRIVEADYFATTFDNGSNNHQNNLRITSGLLLRW